MLLFAKNLLFTILVPGTVAVLVPLCAFRHPEPGMTLGSVVASVLLLIGASVYTSCLWNFAVSGRGTPAPIDPPKTLVVRGPYNYTRNPMYVGVLCVIAAWALLFTSLPLSIYGICVAVSFHVFVLFYEEPHLKRAFGASYEDYCARVNRWLPFPRRSAAQPHR